MLFTSIEFFLFLTAVLAVWRVMPAAGRPMVLLGASYLFYAWWQPWFVLVLAFCTVVGWMAGRMMAGEPDKRKRKRILMAAVGLNLLPLLFFKYYNLFNAALGDGFSLLGWEYGVPALNVLLPLGVSFYTFQAVAYCADVYTGRIEAEDRIGDFALFLAFFPKLISGPIERGRTLLPQLRRDGRNSGNFFGCRIGVRHDEERDAGGGGCPESGGEESGQFYTGSRLTFRSAPLAGMTRRGGVRHDEVGDAEGGLARHDEVGGALFVSGFQLFLWGVFKKIVIADRMAMYVDMVFADPAGVYGKTAIIGAWMFALQIYCDFSAYMDMAIGCGRMFGIELSRNFNFPYMARSVGDFWRRWHITLTSWFRDYVYIPLGGNRVTAGRLAANIMIVFLLSGLWHGAAWTFVWWGGLHGLFYLAGRFTAGTRERIRERLGIRGRIAAVWQVFFTFQLVTLAWVFFRAKTIGDAFDLILNMGVHLELPVRMLSSQFSTALTFGFALVFVGIELVIYWADRRDVDLVQAIPPVVRYPGYAVGLLVMALFGVSSQQFVYFQF